MSERGIKGVVRSLRLGVVMVALGLVMAGQSWGMAVAHGDLTIDGIGTFNVDPALGYTTTSDLQFSTTPSVSDSNGYAASTSTFGSVNAEAGVFKGLYVASASYTELVDISATSGAGVFEFDLTVTSFLKNVGLIPGPTAYGSSTLSASSSCWLEMWNFSLPSPVRVEITGVGDYLISQPFAAGDAGYLKFEILADASAEAVPEPSTFLLLGGGLAGLALLRKKKTA